MGPNKELDKTKRLALIWLSKSGPQFEINNTTVAHIRPYLKHLTDIVDDKLFLAQALQGLSIAPKYIASPEQANSEKLYFVKHRHGAQGKSVYDVYHNQQELKGMVVSVTESSRLFYSRGNPSHSVRGTKVCLEVAHYHLSKRRPSATGIISSQNGHLPTPLDAIPETFAREGVPDQSSRKETSSAILVGRFRSPSSSF
jgi:hypothetical protein